MCGSPLGDPDTAEPIAAAPEWLRTALAQRPTTHEIAVEGATVHYRAWGRVADPAVVLVHGGLAHARWWDHIAPLLSGYRIVALDLTGHGDSAHRDVYTTDQWAREIIAVIGHEELVQPVLVGHSMGGLPAVSAAIELGDAVSGVATVDVRFNDEAWPVRVKESRLYAATDDAIEEFQPAHTHPHISIHPYLLRYVAEASLRGDRRGWRWKRADRYEIRRTLLRSLLPHLTARIAIIRSDFGLLTAAEAEEMLSLAPGPGFTVVVPAAGHNPMLEQPLAFLGVIRTLLGAWRLDEGSTASGQPSDTPSSETT